MLNIKLSLANYPSTSIKDVQGFTSISKFLPNSGNSYGDCCFFVNEEIDNPDYWIIIDDPLEEITTTSIRKDRIFFLGAEVPFVTSYFGEEKFLNQFYKIFSSHAIYNHPRAFSSLPWLPFMINAGHGSSIYNYDPEFNYDRLLKEHQINKTKTLSVIASDKGAPNNKMTEFHSIRYHFAQKLKEHFKDKIDLFGYGYNEIRTKAQAILPYKYHLCLENQATHNVITEKLYDSFLGLSYPIYWGAPNVYEYFSPSSLTSINILDFQGSIQAIEQVIEEKLFEKNFQELIKAKIDVLDKYGIFPRLAQLCSEDFKQSNDSSAFIPQSVTLRARAHFNKGHHKLLNKLKRKGEKLLQYGLPSILAYEIIKHLFFK